MNNIIFISFFLYIYIYIYVSLYIFFCNNTLICIFYVQVDDIAALGVEKINAILESFMGISDTELGKFVLNIIQVINSSQFIESFIYVLLLL